MDSPFQPHLQSFINYLAFEKRYSRHTIVSYQNDLEQFFIYIASQYQATTLTDIATTYIRSWLAEMKGNKITAKTINRKASSLKSFFKYHLKTGSITVTPMWSVITPKISKRLPEFVKEQDMQNMFQYLPFPDDWKGKTDRLLLMLFYQTGMRLSEQVNLKESQVDYSKKVIKVLGKGNKERVVPVSGELVDEMKMYQQAKRKQLENFDNTYFFVLENGKRIYAKYVYLIVKKYLSARAGKPERKPGRFFKKGD